MTNQKTNWKYLLIVIILAFFVGGLSIYQYSSTQKKLGKEIQTTLPPRISQGKYVEMPLEKLKEGKNEINNVIIEKIEPKFLCDGVSGQNAATKVIGYLYIGGEKVPRCEFSCNIEDKAEVKMVGELGTAGGEEFYIDSFSILDKKGRIIDKRERFVIDKIDEPLYGSTYLQLKTFNFTDKIYFLIQGNAIIKHEFKNLFFLYVVDQEEKIKFITSGTENIDYALRYKNNLYLKVREEIWEVGEDDVLKNKFPANKIIIKESEISFQE